MLDARRSKYEKGEHPDALDLKARYELALNLNIDLYYIIVAFTRDFKVVKVIPQYCTAHPLLRIISHVISARTLENGGFFLYAGPRHRSKSSFLRKRVW